MNGEAAAVFLAGCGFGALVATIAVLEYCKLFWYPRYLNKIFQEVVAIKCYIQSEVMKNTAARFPYFKATIEENRIKDELKKLKPRKPVKKDGKRNGTSL